MRKLISLRHYFSPEGVFVIAALVTILVWVLATGVAPR